MEKRNSEKYEYVPDVSHIMRQAGFSMDLIEILAEPFLQKPGGRLPAAWNLLLSQRFSFISKMI